MIIYIKTQGARIIQEGRHLLVKKGEGVYHTLFTYKLKQLVLFGNIEITHSALCQLMKNEIDTVFLTQFGRYLGRLVPLESKNVFLRKRQYQLLDNPEFGLCFVRSVVSGKLSNMATLLMRVKRTRNVAETGAKAKQIKDLMGAPLENAASIDSLRGYEGRGSALYFDGFRHGFVEDMGFTRRVRRPPTDPVNSVLSLLYTFLMNRVYAAVRVAGLDPYVGFLHSLDYGRYSLALDLMEEFRTIIADTLALSLFNLKILQKDDFYTAVPAEAVESGDAPTPDVSTDPIGLISIDDVAAGNFDLPEQRIDETAASAGQVTGKYPVVLRSDAFKRVIDAFEKKLTTSFFYPPAQRHLTYGDVMFYQAAHFRKVLEGEADLYQPVLLK